jgi:hypothetical protein
VTPPGAPVASRDWGAFAGLIWVEGDMTNSSGRLVIRCIVATMDSAVAQSRIGQIGRDGLTNRHEAPSSETEPLLRLEM